MSKPLFLWIDPLAGVAHDALSRSSLSTSQASTSSSSSSSSIITVLTPERPPRIPNVTTPEQALELIHQHYSLDITNINHNDSKDNNNNGEQQQQQQFVGGMGETDAGVAFASIALASVDILQYQYAFLQETMELIRQERHGIPLTIYTSGLLLNNNTNNNNNGDFLLLPPLYELGMDVLQVSLLGGTPAEYVQATKHRQSPSDFGQVCRFVAQALEESGGDSGDGNHNHNTIAVEVGVLAKFATSGRALALALGAQQVHVYDEVEHDLD